MREKMSAVKKRRYLRLVWERIALKEKKQKMHLIRSVKIVPW